MGVLAVPPEIPYNFGKWFPQTLLTTRIFTKEIIQPVTSDHENYLLFKLLFGKRVPFQHIISDNICGALRDLVPFARFKKREKHPWSVNFSKVAG